MSHPLQGNKPKPDVHVHASVFDEKDDKSLKSAHFISNIIRAFQNLAMETGGKVRHEWCRTTIEVMMLQ